MIDLQTEGVEAAISQTQTLLQSAQPIFEAGFCAECARAFADVMVPVRKNGKPMWRMVEVKSSTSVKDYHRDDVATQAFIARSAGVPLAAIALAHIDPSWVYPGGDDYTGLLVANDLTRDAFDRSKEVRGWIAGAQQVVAKKQEPRIATGAQCSKPYESGFLAYCQSVEPQAEQPIHWLPGRSSAQLATHIEAHDIIELCDVPDELLNDRQRRVKTVTLSGRPHFDRTGAARALAAHKLPAYFLDFGTIQFAVPIWKDTRPYQQIPFQFSVHRLSRTGKLEQHAFLDLSGKDPSRAFATALSATCGERGPIFVYNAGFETARIRDAGAALPSSVQVAVGVERACRRSVARCARALLLSEPARELEHQGGTARALS